MAKACTTRHTEEESSRSASLRTHAYARAHIHRQREREAERERERESERARARRWSLTHWEIEFAEPRDAFDKTEPPLRAGSPVAKTCA